MMYIKLIWRNARRSFKDYLIYMVTLTLCVTMFYSFLSISSQYYQPDIGVEYNLDIVSDGMKLAVFTLTLLLLVLIQYVNRFMIRRRQKEFAVQTIMGMEQRVTAWLFFGETLIMGLCSLVLANFGRRSVFPVYHRHVDECFWERISVHMAFVSRYHWNYGGFFPSLFCLNRFFSSADYTEN